jgi:phosphoglycerol transferase MdoB-like AlkP superfamily enzyme
LIRAEAARAFVVRATLASLLAGLAIHIRILVTAPIVPARPAMWLLLATLQDVATLTLVAAIVNFIVIPAAPRAAQLFIAIVSILRVIAQAGLAEVTIFFGHGLFRENLQMALHPTLFAGSLQGHTLAAIVCFALLLSILLFVAFLTARRWPSTRSNLFLATVAVLSFIGAVIMPPVHLAETTSTPEWTLVRLLNNDAINNARGTMTIPRPAGKATDIRVLMPKRHRNFISDAYPLAYVPPPRTPGLPLLTSRPNIVFWLMEGLRPHEIDAYGGPIPNLTPVFDSLVPQSIFFEKAYSVGSFTPEGELAMWYGLQSSPYEIVIRTRPAVNVYGLPEILAHDGYHLLWMHPSEAELYLSTRFYLRRDFRVIDGRDFDPRLASTNWGYSDRALAKTLVATIDRLQQPFAAMGVTVSNHHPYQVPSDATTRVNLPHFKPKHGYRDLGISGFQEGEHTLPRLHSTHYSDEALGYFLTLARSRPWFGNTIFIIAGDHGAPTKPYGRSIENIHDFLELRHRVAMLIYSPLLAPRVIREPVSHVDILPTLLGLIGDTHPRAGLGLDVLDPADADDQRMIVTWSDAHAVVLHDAHFTYEAMLRRDGDRYEITSESLFNASDDLGARDLASSHPADVARFRQAANAYVDTYGWLIASGHTGVPR